MTSVKDFCEKAELKQLTNLEETAEITDGYICDLLSWVMARGTEGMAWIDRVPLAYIRLNTSPFCISESRKGVNPFTSRSA